MVCDLEPVDLDDRPAWRVAYEPDPWRFPDWRYASDPGRFDGRWDDPEGRYRVLYAAADPFAAYVEVLADFRPDPAVVAGLEEIEVENDVDEDDGVPPGSVPTSWTRGRVLGQARLSGRYAEVGHSRSLAYLRRELAALVVRHKLDDLDAATIRLRAPREFTQKVSRFVYECTDEGGRPEFHGVVYRSRHGDDLVNFATFEMPDDGAAIVTTSATAIDADDEDLRRAMDHLDLVWHDDRNG
jgi:hypothetical protein